MKTALDYDEMVSDAMKSDKLAHPWFDYLKSIQIKQNKESELLKIGRAKHPGRTDYEILGYSR